MAVGAYGSRRFDELQGRLRRRPSGAAYRFPGMLERESKTLLDRVLRGAGRRFHSLPNLVILARERGAEPFAGECRTKRRGQVASHAGLDYEPVGPQRHHTIRDGLFLVQGQNDNARADVSAPQGLDHLDTGHVGHGNVEHE